MFEISGKVQLEGTGIGIPDLIVAAFDVDAAPGGIATNRPPAIGSTRLGSVITGARGEFKISFETEEFAAGDPDGRPDLTLLVLAPERALENGYEAVPLEQRILFTHATAIANAGRHEALLVTLRESALRSRGVPVPGHSLVARDTLLAQRVLGSSTELHRTIKLATRAALAEPLQFARQTAAVASRAFERFSLSRFTAEHQASANYARRGDSVVGKLESLAGKRLRELSNAGRRAKVRVLVTGDDLRELGLSLAGSRIVGSVERPYRDLAKYLEASRDMTTLDAVSLATACCAEQDATRRISAMVATADVPPPGQPTTPVSIDNFVRDMVERQTRSAEPPDVGIEMASKRATRDSIESTIRSFEVRGGPADASAFHDFYDLQIAFEDVWTELFDHRIGQKGKKLFDAWVTLQNRISGESPSNLEMSIESRAALEAYLAEAEEFHDRLVALNPPPPSMKKLVPEITAAIWNGLDPDDQTILIDLAGAMDALAKPYTTVEIVEFIADLQELRTTAREVLTRTKERTPSFVKAIEELKSYLLEPHRFDIFAPDSINLGLLVNYRQQWTPLSYQVGDLVQTLPLAPKEIRRYSRKEVIKKSRAEKEIEDAQRIRRSESSDTSRVDAEIVNRAANKTNFNANAQGGFNVGVGTLNISSGFGMEAETLSSKTKKVVMAAPPGTVGR